MGSPVIFVHGIGASDKVWQRFEIPNHPVFYISFSHRFAGPESQVPELAKYINSVLKKTKQEKVILICHSMGGLVARKYLVDHKDSHKVSKLILLSTPNLGSLGLSINWVPLALIIVGALGYMDIWPLLFCLLGFVWEMISYFRGILLLSPAAWAMRPYSKFLRELNSREAPVDVKYVSVLSDTKALPHRLVNLLLFLQGGDGAVPLSSQKLSKRCMTNFSKLDYSELRINLPHFVIPLKAEKAIQKAITL